MDGTAGLITVNENFALVVVPELSVTVAVKVAVWAMVGVPVMAPEGARVSPAGSDPPVIVQVYPPEPPVAERFWLELAPKSVGGNCNGLRMVSCSVPVMVMVNACGALTRFPLATSAENVEVPAAVGVPVIAPEDAFSIKPAGKEPETMVQLYTDPPVAARVAE